MAVENEPSVFEPLKFYCYELTLSTTLHDHFPEIEDLLLSDWLSMK